MRRVQRPIFCKRRQLACYFRRILVTNAVPSATGRRNLRAQTLAIAKYAATFSFALCPLACWQVRYDLSHGSSARGWVCVLRQHRLLLHVNRPVAPQPRRLARRKPLPAAPRGRLLIPALADNLPMGLADSPLIKKVAAPLPEGTCGHFDSAC